MTRLLPAQGASAASHLSQHVAVTHRGADHPDPFPAQGLFQPEVGHHRGDQDVAGQTTVLAQPAREEQQHGVPVHQVPFLVGCQTAIGIAIEGQAQAGPGLADGHEQLLGVGGSAVPIDVDSVGTGRQDRRSGPQRLKDPRSHPPGRAVSAVQDDLEAIQARGSAADQVFHIEVLGLFRAGLHPTQVGSDGAGKLVCLRDERFQGLLLLIGELETQAVEKLDPVVLHRVVAGRDHRAAVGLESSDQPGDPRGGHDAQQDHICPGRAQTRHTGRLQHLTADPGVAPDGDARTASIAAQEMAVGPPDPEGQLGGQVAVGDPAHSVGSKE